LLTGEYVPIEQGEHTPFGLMKEPAGQFTVLLTQLAAPEGELVPAGHAVHELAPMTSLYELASHRLQALRPDSDENMPRGQVGHSALPAKAVKRPTGHSRQDEEPWIDAKRPTGHKKHTSAFTTELNVPGAHGRHPLLLVRRVPTWHDSTHAVEPIALDVPAGQALHELEPAVEENVLVVQRKHTLRSVALEKVPAGQSEHAD
jgi:hypothetical protein